MKLINESEPVFTIGIVAQKLGISEHMIRIYEREGLIIPYRKESGHRLFSQRDMERIKCIKKIIVEGKVSVAGIKRLLALIPCWEIKGCPMEIRVKCPSYFDYTKPCWLNKEYLSGKRITDECRECSVYNSVKSCDELKELLKKYIVKN